MDYKPNTFCTPNEDIYPPTNRVFRLRRLRKCGRLRATYVILSTRVTTYKRLQPLSNVDGGEVWIDGFNVIITLEVMLSTSTLFEGMDGTIRDLASLRGTYRIIDETSVAIKMLFDTLGAMNVAKVNILLDEPDSNSGRLKVLIAEIAENYNGQNTM